MAAALETARPRLHALLDLAAQLEAASATQLTLIWATGRLRLVLVLKWSAAEIPYWFPSQLAGRLSAAS